MACTEFGSGGRASLKINFAGGRHPVSRIFLDTPIRTRRAHARARTKRCPEFFLLEDGLADPSYARAREPLTRANLRTRDP
jgi:hypothetical protein